MDKEISPEERLFNVIKAGKNPFRLSPGRGALKASPWSAGMPILFEMPMGLGDIDIKKVNAVLAAILLLVTAAVFFNLIHKREISLKNLPSVYPNISTANTVPARGYKPFDFYLKQVNKRDLFHPVTQGAGGVAAAQATAKDFALSGIYMGQYPQAIITDTAEQKTYFLKEGDDIKGYKVKSITNNRVILQKGDEEIDLI